MKLKNLILCIALLFSWEALNAAPKKKGCLKKHPSLKRKRKKMIRSQNPGISREQLKQKIKEFMAPIKSECANNSNRCGCIVNKVREKTQGFKAGGRRKGRKGGKCQLSRDLKMKRNQFLGGRNKSSRREWRKKKNNFMKPIRQNCKNKPNKCSCIEDGVRAKLK